jgi:hypothetical protein
MLGGIALFGLALTETMKASVWVVLPFALAGAAICPLTARGPFPEWRTFAAFVIGWVFGRGAVQVRAHEPVAQCSIFPLIHSLAGV